jgi:hypothetical protein
VASVSQRGRHRVDRPDDLPCLELRSWWRAASRPCPVHVASLAGCLGGRGFMYRLSRAGPLEDPRQCPRPKASALLIFSPSGVLTIPRVRAR